MTTLVLCGLVLWIGIIDAFTRRIPESLCVGGVLFALGWAVVAPEDRLDPVSIRLPWFVSMSAWAMVVLAIQPGMIWDARRGPREAIGLLLVSVRRRGVMQIAVALIGLGWGAIAIATWLSPVHRMTTDAVVAGAAVGLLGLGIPHLIGRAVRGGGSIGSGDCLAMAMIGALAGPQVVVVAMTLTIAGIVIASLIATWFQKKVIPIGPVIAATTLVTLAVWSRYWPRLAVVFADPVLIAAVWSIGIFSLCVLASVWLLRSSRRRHPTRWVTVAACALFAVATFGVAMIGGIRRDGSSSLWGSSFGASSLAGQDQSPLADVLNDGVEIAAGGGSLAVKDATTGEVQLLAGSHSLQAMLQSDRRGVRWIELGLVETSDGKLVALRSWGEASKHWLGDAWTGRPLSKQDFGSAANRRGWTPMDLPAIFQWLRQDEARHVLIDGDAVWDCLIRHHVAKARSTGERSIGELPLDVRQRLIPMLDRADPIAKIRAAGLPYHVWVVRPEAAVTDYQVIQHCRNYEPVAVAAHYGRLRDSSLPEKLKGIGVPSIAIGVRTKRQKSDSRADAALTPLAGVPQMSIEPESH